MVSLDILDILDVETVAQKTGLPVAEIKKIKISELKMRNYILFLLLISNKNLTAIIEKLPYITIKPGLLHVPADQTKIKYTSASLKFTSPKNF